MDIFCVLKSLSGEIMPGKENGNHGERKRGLPGYSGGAVQTFPQALGLSYRDRRLFGHGLSDGDAEIWNHSKRLQYRVTGKEDVSVKEMSEARKKELYWFARQYPEWIEELESLGGIPSAVTSMKRGTDANDPTAELVEKMDILKAKISLVEKAVKLSGSDLLFLAVLNELKD